MKSCLTGNADCVQLMIDEGALMEAHDCHFGTPLHVACARQHYDCAEVLLKAGESVPYRKKRWFKDRILTIFGDH